MRAKEFISELFTQNKSWEWTFRGSEESLATFTIGDIKYIFHAYTDIYDKNGIWEVEFKMAGRGNFRQKFGLTGTGNSVEVMSTVVAILKEFLQENIDKVNILRFTAKESSRKALYARMVKRLLPDWSISIDGPENEFTVSRPKEISEDTELLDETAQQEQILVHIANQAVARIVKIFNRQEKKLSNIKTLADLGLIMSRRDQLTWHDGILLKDLFVSQVNDPVISKMINTVTVKLIDNFTELSMAGSLGALITYTSGKMSIELYLINLLEDAKETGHFPADALTSTLIHEMQHALDSIKSQGRYNNSSDKRAPEIDSDEKFNKYLQLPHEINARFLQALLDISVRYKTPGPHRLQDLISSAFVEHKLNVVNRQQYVRLVSRAYKFFDAMQNTPIRVEPKSLARRALAWITGQAVSEIK